MKLKIAIKKLLKAAPLFASILFIGNLFPTHVAEATFASTVAADGAVAHWNFEEASGNLLDQIGSNNGTLVGTPTVGQTAQVGNSYHFITNQGIDLPDDTFDAQTEGSIEAMIRVDSSPVTSSIFSVGDSTSDTNNNIYFGTSVSHGQAQLIFVSKTPTESNKIYGTTYLTPGTWYHVAAQVSSTTGIKLFVNGIEETYIIGGGATSSTAWLSDVNNGAGLTHYSMGYIHRATSFYFYKGNIDELAIYDAPKSASIWRNHYLTAFNLAEAIAITNPAPYQVYQRNGSNQADIAVSGTLTGSATTVEYQLDSGAWTTLDASPTSSTFSGTIPAVAVGSHTVSVRFSNNTSVSTTSANVRVGDVFGWIGQSNQTGDFTNGQPYTGTAAAVLDTSGSWVNLQSNYSDPSTSAYSVLPRLASFIEAQTGYPVGFVAAPVSGTALVIPTPEWSKGGARYNAFTSLITSGKVNGLKSILWYQGERDANSGISSSTYAAAESQMLDDLQADTGFATTTLISANIANYIGGNATGVAAVHDAKIYNWINDSDIYPGPTGHDQTFSLHWTTDAEAVTLAGRWWRAIYAALYGGTESARGPQFSSAQYLGSTVTVTFTGGEGALQNATDTTGWVVTDNNGTRTVSGATGTSNTVTLTVDQTLSAPVYVSFAYGNNGAGATLRDSGTYPMPPEPFGDKLATVSDATAPVVSDNGSSSGELAAGTTQATLAVSTNENAQCRYGTTSGTAFASMTDIFSTTGTSSSVTSHTTTITGLTDSTNYTYYVRCIDVNGNANLSDLTISFSVASGVSTGGSPLRRSVTAPSGGFGVSFLPGSSAAESSVLRFDYDTNISKMQFASDVGFAEVLKTIRPVTNLAADKLAEGVRFMRFCDGRGRCSDPVALPGTTPVTPPVSAPSTNTSGEAGVSRSFTRNLDTGAEGDDVTALQRFLIAGGYTIPAGATGYFGQQTVSALRQFQSDNNIYPAVGYFGPLTREFITDASSSVTQQSVNPSTISTESITPTSTRFSKDLEFNDIDDEVRQLQAYLNTHGYIVAESGPGSVGNETNIFGAKTREALIRFQEAFASEILTSVGLARGTGYFGPSTRAYINTNSN